MHGCSYSCSPATHLAEEQHDNANQDVAAAGHEEGPAPGLGGRHVFHNASVDEGHDELRGAPSHVAPASGDGIGRAHDVDGEHGADPELAAHKGAEGHADEEAHGLEAARVRHHRLQRGSSSSSSRGQGRQLSGLVMGGTCSGILPEEGGAACGQHSAAYHAEDSRGDQEQGAGCAKAGALQENRGGAEGTC